MMKTIGTGKTLQGIVVKFIFDTYKMQTFCLTFTTSVFSYFRLTQSTAVNFSGLF